MAERKPLSKKLRFQILNRDNFTCQYCGRKAPDVILEVDHIVPVAKGGKTEVENLITACHDCNSGKKAESLIRPTTIESADLLIEEYIKNEARIYMSKYGRIKALSKWVDMVQDNMKLDDDWNEFLKENESIWED